MHYKIIPRDISSCLALSKPGRLHTSISASKGLVTVIGAFFFLFSFALLFPQLAESRQVCAEWGRYVEEPCTPTGCGLCDTTWTDYYDDGSEVTWITNVTLCIYGPWEVYYPNWCTTPEENYGRPAPEPDPGTGPGTDPDNSKKGCGSPVWEVNKINMNLYITDTPLWYTPAIGPSVDIQLSYNSRGGARVGAPFGNKWVLNYGSYIIEVNQSGIIKPNVFMPDGRKDVYTQNGSAYTQPYGVFNTLTKTGSQYKLQLQNGTIYTYEKPSPSSDYILKQITDAYNNSITLGYTGNQLTTITDAQGLSTTLTYTDNLVTTVTDPFGRTATFQYVNGNLTQAVDMGGYWTNYDYETNIHDNKVYIKSIQNAKGTWQFKIEHADGLSSGVMYPMSGANMGTVHRITITDPLGDKEEYFSNGLFTNHVEPRDYVPYQAGNPPTNNMNTAKKTVYSLNISAGTGQTTKITRPEGGYTTYTNYDPVAARPQLITDYHGTDANNNPITHTSQYTYNTNGRTTSVIDPRTKTTTYTYYPNNIDLHYITNPLGSITFTYNGATHDIASITDRLSNVTELTYNTYGQMTTITEAKNTTTQTVTELIYDPASHNLTEVKKAGSTISTLTYDAIGRVQTQTDTTGITTTLEYNNLDKVTRVTFPDTKFIQINRSTLHPHIIDSVTDRGGQTTSYTHDALNRLYQVAGPQGTYDYRYDKNGNMTKLIDSNRTPAVETLFEYNLDDQLKKKIYADTKYQTYGYDKAGLLTSTSNARNIATTFTYDPNHNLLKTDYGDTTPDVTNTYDDYNRLWTRSDGTGTTTYGYNNNNKLTSVDGPQSNDNITYQYDERNRVKGLIPQTGQALSYVYDSLGRLRDIQAGTNTFTYAYSGASQLIQSLTRPNGSYTEYQYYDQPNQMKNLKAVINKKSTGDVINKFEYTYNTRDLIETETITNGQIIDNFITGSTTETPNILNQIMSKTAQGTTKTYVYDNDGNMTTGFTPEGYPITMTYDAQNRMKSAEYTDVNNVAHKNEYTYAGNSLLAELRKYDAGSLTATTKYLRAAFLPIQERDAANTVSREYTWGLNLGGGIGGLLNLKQGGADYSYLYDGKGNVSALIDSSQAVVASYAYDPFGRLMSKSGSLDQHYTFSTKEYDSRTGFNNYGYRFYDSCAGKWTTRDPLEEAGGYNLYQAVGNNPVNFTDPFGFFKAGGPRAPYPGHADFPGGNYFDYNREDTDPKTNPMTGDPKRHFRDLPVSEHDVANAINSCNEDAFQRAMHRGQDYFSHYSKGFRWKPGTWTKGLGLGHLFPLIGVSPDSDRDAWKAAAKWSQERLNEWNKKCGCRG